MRRLYAPFFGSLLLLFIACKKENRPTLEGRWVKERGTATSYDERNQLVSVTDVPGTYSIEITGETFQYYRGDGVADGGPYGYTRQGNKVIFTNKGELTITTLTEHKLTLHYEDTRPSSPPYTRSRTNTDQYFTR